MEKGLAHCPGWWRGRSTELGMQFPALPPGPRRLQARPFFSLGLISSGIQRYLAGQGTERRKIQSFTGLEPFYLYSENLDVL